MALYGQGDDEDADDRETGRGSFQRIRRAPAGYFVQYGFRNFNQDELVLTAKIPAQSVEESVREFGYRPEQLKPINAWYQETRDKTGEQMPAGVDKEYQRRRRGFYQSVGFRVTGPREVAADVPAMIRRNAGRLVPAVEAFSRIAQERDYGAEELSGAVASMAQTAMRYSEVGTYQGTKVIGGMLTPPYAFVQGQGDCDTKSALIASILANWSNVHLVGLDIPGHYLLAMRRAPARGDAYVEYEGFPYVMIESSGPAWLVPGKVGEYTQQYLASGKLFGIQPI